MAIGSLALEYMLIMRQKMSDFPLYMSFPGLLELAKQRIISVRSGHGYYSFFQETWRK